MRVWTFPGNSGDSSLLAGVKDDLLAWKLGRVVWVTDRGFASADNRRQADNRRHLQRAGDHYIMGEKLRGRSAEARAALATSGRYQIVSDTLEVREVVIDDGTLRDRFVVCRDPAEVERDATERAVILGRIEAAIAEVESLSPGERDKAVRELQASREARCFLRPTPDGRPHFERSAVAADASLDGKFLLQTSDPTLPAAEVALGYKQLLEVERAWRDTKTYLDLRPIYHRKEARIRAHVLLCWLALFLVRLAENATGETWRTLRTELENVTSDGSLVEPRGRPADRAVRPPERDLRRAPRARATPLRPPQDAGERPHTARWLIYPAHTHRASHGYTFTRQLRNRGSDCRAIY